LRKEQRRQLGKLLPSAELKASKRRGEEDSKGSRRWYGGHKKEKQDLTVGRGKSG